MCNKRKRNTKKKPMKKQKKIHINKKNIKTQRIIEMSQKLSKYINSEDGEDECFENLENCSFV